MAIKMVSLNCPNCNGVVKIDEDTNFCPYCGSKLILYNDNEYVYRKIDEAEILREKNRARSIEIERTEREKAGKVGVKLLLGVCVFYVCLFIFIMIMAIITS